MAKKILFVAMQMSIHTSRWINQIVDEGFEVHLFPVNHLPVHADLHGVTVHQPFIPLRPKFILKQLLKKPKSLLRGLSHLENLFHANKITVNAIYPVPMLTRMMMILNGIKKTSLGESQFSIPSIYGPRALSRLIKKLKPDLIHSLEFQHCGYNVLRAKELCGADFPLWMATNWGSDIYYYRHFDDHRLQISRLLANIDYYSCECERDVRLAEGLGLAAEVMSIAPNTGGFNLKLIHEMREIHKPSSRKIIMVKGYQHFVGRALTALDAVEACHQELQGFKIVVFSASSEVHLRVNELKKYFSLDIEVLAHSNHLQILKMFSRARVYLGVSLSDAISTSLLEAIALGAFPIQTNTSCCSEWIEDGKSGFEIPADNLSIIVDRLKKALQDDALVDEAAHLNWKTTCERLDERQLKQSATAIYQRIFNEHNENR